MDERRGREQKPMKLAIFFLPSLIAFNLLTVTVDALHIDIRSNPLIPLYVNPPIAFNSVEPRVSMVDCSRKCESDHCSMPPLMRYGKYCGLLYNGCAGEDPCDSLDACCQAHDACIEAQDNDYMNVECNEKFLDCIGEFRDSRAPSFKGNTCEVGEVVDLMSFVIQAALLFGRAHP